jgi:histidine ammonia-lyase|tara:strand:- start:50318 stop:51853 length:1536 start_codon:yes stop_codon:yes gene_type:complete
MGKRTVSLNGSSLSIKDVLDAGEGSAVFEIDESAVIAMTESRSAVKRILEKGEVVYGINTGFGALSSVTIEHDQLEQLQYNLIRSHACGVGDAMESEHVLMMMVIRANTLCIGHSGCRPEVVELLVQMVNEGIAPIVPRIGSLGASGDLAPLSHMALGMIGEGDCHVRHGDIWAEPQTSASALEQAGIVPLILQAKEGLSLINGTSQMCAYLSICMMNMDHLVFAADASAACSVEAIYGSHTPFDSRVHNARPQRGQLISAARISSLLMGSKINESHIDCGRVQDAYSFRCAPQVHGPVIDLLAESRRMLEIEINSATDNPLIFTNGSKDDVISGGNFHGQNLSLAADALALSCHELASISERRINHVMDPQWTGQNAFLTNIEGLESGLMIIQYVAAALISELHLLSNPVSISNVPVSLGKEDHVSMGATSTFRSMQSTVLLAQVIANELICSNEALRRTDLDAGLGVRTTTEWVSSQVPALTSDRAMSEECMNLAQALLLGGLSEALGE